MVIVGGKQGTEISGPTTRKLGTIACCERIIERSDPGLTVAASLKLLFNFNAWPHDHRIYNTLPYYH